MQFDQNIRPSHETIDTKLTVDLIKNAIIDPIESILKNLDNQLKKFQQNSSIKEQIINLQDNNIVVDKKNEPIINKITSDTSYSNMKTKADAGDVDFKFYTKYKEYKRKAMEAYRNRKVFTLFTCTPCIRKSLKNRGWVEKCTPNYLKRIQMLPLNQILRHAADGNEYETIAISKLLHPHPAQFIWQPKYPRIEMKNKIFVFALRNRIYRSRELDFTSKIGLIGCIELSHWNTIPSIAEVRSPRHFCLSTNDEQAEFLNDYKTTYCISLLIFVTEEPTENVFSEFGSVSINVLKFAINRLKSEIEHRTHFDIDNDINQNSNYNHIEPKNQEEWQRFYLDCDLIQSYVMRIDISGGVDYKRFIKECQNCLNDAKQFWPTLETDGFNNLWILKPANACRGHGIVIHKSYTDIIEWVTKNPNRKYIVQKYLERPLLIYNTKFDIRQYFLMTISDDCVCVWMYKDCYLKFSSQEYDLQNFKESIHITNNAVQKKYRNATIRNKKLPNHNMWHLDQFKSYMIENNINESIWNDTVYSAMKKNIIAIVSTSLDETEFIPNTFEIYGCDFILDQNYEPFLLEINATPDMSPSTKVTAQLCPKVLEDLVKVVVDRQENPECDTGDFELIFQTIIPKVPLPISLSVIGKQKPIIKVPFDSVLLNATNKICEIQMKPNNTNTEGLNSKKNSPKMIGKLEPKLTTNLVSNFKPNQKIKTKYKRKEAGKSDNIKKANTNSKIGQRNEKIKLKRKVVKKKSSIGFINMNASEAVLRLKETVDRIKNENLPVINYDGDEKPKNPNEKQKLNSSEKVALSLKSGSQEITPKS